MPVMLRAVGNVESSSTVEVRSQVSGALLTVEFREGQDVKEGDLLFTIDSRPFEIALRQAEAALAKDMGQAKNTESQRARYTDLRTRGIVSQSDFDAINAQANALQSTIALDNVQIDNARLQLQYTKIRAPMSGRTGALLVHPGALIRNNDASPMVVINRLMPAYVSFAVPSRALPAIRAGQSRAGLQVTASLAGDAADPPSGAAGASQDQESATQEGASIGRVDFIDNAIDQTTDTIRVKAVFPNRDHRLWPGQFVEVALRVSEDERAIVVPSVAVQPGQQGTFVWVVSAEQSAAVRPVVVARTEGQLSVIKSGLAAGDVVVTDGQLRLTPGARVSVKPDAKGRS